MLSLRVKLYGLLNEEVMTVTEDEWTQLFMYDFPRWIKLRLVGYGSLAEYELDEEGEVIDG